MILSRDEELCLAQQAYAGSTEARAALIEHNIGLVAYIAHKYDHTRLSVDDMISIGTIGLIKAADTFNPDKGFKLATYASRCIENEIVMELRKRNRRRREISLETPISGSKRTLACMLGTAPDTVSRRIEAAAEREMLRAALLDLPERDRLVISMRYGLNGEKPSTQLEVAMRMGITQSHISRLERSAIARLKVKMQY